MTAPSWRFRRRRVRRVRGAQSVLLLALAIALIPLTAVAAEIASGDTVIVSTPVDDDLYVFGADVRVDATVTGDITAIGARVRVDGDVGGSVFAAGAHVIVNGDVGGSVMATAADVDVRGDVGHAIRAAANDLRIESSVVTGDVVAAGGAVQLDDDSRVGGDVVTRAGDVVLNGDVGGEIRGSSDELRIAGAVGGRIDVRVGRLSFAGGALVTQPVEYTSDHELRTEPGTSIGSDVRHIEPNNASIVETIEESLLWAIFRFAWAFALGLFLLWIAPDQLRDVCATLTARPLRSLAFGALALVGVPLAILLLLVTVVGIPVALLVLAAFVVALYASQIVVGLAIGQAITPARWRRGYRGGAATMLAIGLAIVVVVRSLPIPSWYPVIALVTAAIALGALALSIVRGPAGRDRSIVGSR
jgi:cytoskeletal protein CcmA (bactofilin family)